MVLRDGALRRAVGLIDTLGRETIPPAGYYYLDTPGEGLFAAFMLEQFGITAMRT